MLGFRKFISICSTAVLANLSAPTPVLAQPTPKPPVKAANKPSAKIGQKIAVASPVAQEDAIRLNQTHYFMGKEEVTLSANGIRIENTSQLKFVLIAKAPEWRVYVYRLDDKTYFTQSLNDFLENGLMSNFCFTFKDEFLKNHRFSTEKTNIDGFEATRVVAPSEKFEVLDNVTVPQASRRILWMAYKVTTNGGVPLLYWGHVGGVDVVTGMNRKREIEKRLETTTIKRVKVSPHEFELPSGLKALHSMREAVAGESTRHNDDEMRSLLRM